MEKDTIYELGIIILLMLGIPENSLNTFITNELN